MVLLLLLVARAGEGWLGSASWYIRLRRCFSGGCRRRKALCLWAAAKHLKTAWSQNFGTSLWNPGLCGPGYSCETSLTLLDGGIGGIRDEMSRQRNEHVLLGQVFQLE